MPQLVLSLTIGPVAAKDQVLIPAPTFACDPGPPAIAPVDRGFAGPSQTGIAHTKQARTRRRSLEITENVKHNWGVRVISEHRVMT